MEDSAKGPHHPRPEVERPQLLQPHPYLSHLRPQHRPRLTDIWASDDDGHRFGQHHFFPDYANHLVQFIWAQLSYPNHGPL